MLTSNPQYVKQEQIETLADGTKKAIAIRQITERASSRIGRMAFELALKRAEERAANPGGSFWTVRSLLHRVCKHSTDCGVE